MPTTVLSQSLVALLVASGCGDDQLGGAINPRNARALIEQLELVPPAMDAENAADALLAAHNVKGAVYSLIAPGNEPTDFIPDDTPPSEYGPGTWTCTSSSLCSFSYSTYQTSFTGSLARIGETIDFALSYDNPGGFATKGAGDGWTFGDLDPVLVGATELDGELRYHYGAVGWFGKGGTQTGVVVDLRAIMLDATGCPVAGSLRASLTYLAPMLDAGSPPPGEVPQQASFAVHGTVAFGPRCGEATY